MSEYIEATDNVELWVGTANLDNSKLRDVLFGVTGALARIRYDPERIERLGSNLARAEDEAHRLSNDLKDAIRLAQEIEQLLR